MIPEDVIAIAESVLIDMGIASTSTNYDAIARAILTDREARSGWRDIASLTPEDGMIVVGYGEYRERDGFSPAFMRWHAVLNGWTVTGMPFYPTHWMPIPAAPSASPSPSREETETRDTSALLLEAEKALDLLRRWDALIEHQYSGSRDAMSDMTEVAQETAAFLAKMRAE